MRVFEPATSAPADRGQVDLDASAIERKRWPFALGVGAALVAWMSVLIASSTNESLWGDEAFVVAMVRQPWGQLLHALQHIDVNMSAYYLVAKSWTAAFGVSDRSLRSLSVILVAASFPLLWMLMARIAGTRAAVAAVALAMTNPFVATIALTARSYALLWLLCVASLVLVDRALRQPSVPAWLAWGGLGAVMLYAHLLAVLVLAGEALFIVIRLRRAHRLDRGFLIACGVLAMSAIPTLVYLAPSNTLAWIPPFSVGQAYLTTRTALGGPVVAVAVVALAVGGAALLITRRQVSTRRGLFAVVGATYCALLVALLPVQTLFVELYFTPLTVFALGLAALALASIRRPGIQRSAVVLVSVCGLVAIATTTLPRPAVSHQDWRGTTAALAGAVEPGDAIAFPNSFYRPAFEHYATTYPRALVAQPALPGGAWGTVSAYSVDRLNRVNANVTVERVDTETASVDRIWLVAPTGDERAANAERLLKTRGWRIERTIRRPGTTSVALVHSDAS